MQDEEKPTMETQNIQVQVKTAQRIKDSKITQLETYDEIINRVFDFYDKNFKEG